MNKFKTAKGTELPIMQLKGKDYLQVAHRLVWFREEHPTWSIETEFVQLNDKFAIARATIRDDAGRIISTAHKREDQGHFGDFMEKAETGALGRALAYVGYGTQFCADEIDEGTRIVDAPTVRATVPQAAKPVAPRAQVPVYNPQTKQVKSITPAIVPQNEWEAFDRE